MTVINQIFRKVRRALNQFASTRIIIITILSFSMWLMVKLKNTYTTDINLLLTIENHKYELTCVFEGDGMKLLRYSIIPPEMTISLDEVQHRTVKVYDDDAKAHGKSALVRKIRVSHKSLVDAVNIKFSDIKVVSVSEMPDLPVE